MMGYVIESSLKAEYGVPFPWWLCLILGVAFTFAVTYQGIEISAAALLVLSILEMFIVVLLAASRILRGYQSAADELAAAEENLTGAQFQDRCIAKARELFWLAQARAVQAAVDPWVEERCGRAHAGSFVAHGCMREC
jgi:hypothetical protein